MTEEDYESLYAATADFDATKHYPYVFDEKRVRGWISKNIERYRVFGFGLWTMVLKESGEMIGDCGITMQNINGFIRPEIGYHVRKDFQRRGFATEAAKKCRDWTFENTPFRIVYSYMKKSNALLWRWQGLSECEKRTNTRIRRENEPRFTPFRAKNYAR